MILFFLFVAIPVIEIALFIQVGGLIGLWPTLAIVVGTAVLGSWLMRTQGALALARLRDTLSRAQDPTEPLAHGAMILVAGVLLLTPGFFTDTIGLLLLVPPVRSMTFRFLRSRLRFRNVTMGATTGQARDQKADIIDGAFEEVDSPDQPKSGGSQWTKH